jgi:hypothetical protein
MLNKTAILNAASRFFRNDKLNKLSQAYDYARSVIDAVNNPQEAFQKAGITKETIQSAKKLANSPLAGWAIAALGGDKESFINGLNVAEESLNSPMLPTLQPTLQNSPLSEQAPDNELTSLQNDLKRLK